MSDQAAFDALNGRSEYQIDPGASDSDGSDNGQAADGQENEQQEQRQKQEPAPKVNLYETPEFRQWQSARDKQAADQARQYEDRIAELEKKSEEAILRSLPKDQQAAYRTQQLERQLQQARQENAGIHERNEFASSIQEILDTTEAPFEKLDVSSVGAAWRSAATWQKEQVRDARLATPEKLAARSQHQPATSNNAGQSFDMRKAEALKNRDAAALLELSSEAALEGKDF